MTKRNHTPSARLAKTKFHQRQLKVRQAYHSYQLKQCKPIPVGEIHLKGRWLIEAGFEINTPVKVRIMAGCLVVTIVPEPNTSLKGFNQLNQREQRVIKDIMKELLVKYQN